MFCKTCGTLLQPKKTEYGKWMSCPRGHTQPELNQEKKVVSLKNKTVKRVEEHLNKHNVEATIYCDDGCTMEQTPDNFADLVMTCPPYHQLEKYESVDGQLSDLKTYEKFLDMIEICGKNINRILKPGGFCVWVCGDWRESGKFRSFHSDSIGLFEKARLITHDIIIMKNKSPFISLQMSKVAAKRYTSKTHEYVLVFRKEGELEVNTDKIVKKVSDKFWG